MSSLPSIGAWRGAARFDSAGLMDAAARIREPVHVVRDASTGAVGVGFGGDIQRDGAHALLAVLPALYPEWLGDRSFAEAHGCRFPYVTGAMANGIATVEMVVEAGRAGCLGFFGAAGLALEQVEAALLKIGAALPEAAWGSNLIHSPNEPMLEAAVADLYLRRGVRRVSAAAYTALTPAIVRYAATGLSRDESGRVVRRNYVFAKVSRPAVARRFMSPAPAAMLSALVAQGLLTAAEAALAATVPVAEDITVEADSGGHTDNQALSALLPTVLKLRDALAPTVRVGAAGSLGTPSAVAAAFTMGAAYVLTGSVNQSAKESGLDATGRALLAEAALDDVMMAPSADMFEMGVEVQVLRRGTMFGVRARRLYDLYVAHPSLEAIPVEARSRLEREILLATVQEAWASTSAYWTRRDPAEVARAERDPKHKMALVFRAYLGQASRWAIVGDQARKLDHQIWCGPAMGAFNAWVAGSPLEAPEARTVKQIALNLLEGAAVALRAQQLRSAGAPVPSASFDFRPRRLA